MILLYLIGILAALFAYNLGLFFYFPQTARPMQARGDHERARKRLEWILRMPGAEAFKMMTRLKLGPLYVEQQEYERATEQYRRLLDTLRKQPNPALESDTRRRLADCMDKLAQPVEAAHERERALQCLTQGKADALGMLSRGAMLGQQNRFEEAYGCYLRALELIPESSGKSRAEVLVRLSNTAYQKGDPEAAVQHAEAALALSPEDRLREAAHSMAGIGYSTQGMLDQADVHRERLLDLATRLGNRNQAAMALMQLAVSRYKRGDFTRAYELLQQSISMFTEGPGEENRRIAYTCLADCYRTQGRWEEARRAYEETGMGRRFMLQAGEDRITATNRFGRGILELEAGCPEEALACFEQTRPVLQNDPKLALWVEANRMTALALAGRGEEAAPIAAQVTARMANFATDHETQQNCRWSLLKTAYYLGDDAGCLAWATHYLAGCRTPLGIPGGCCFAGLAHLRQGDLAAAQAAFERALDLSLDTHYTRLCREQSLRI